MQNARMVMYFPRFPGGNYSLIFGSFPPDLIILQLNAKGNDELEMSANNIVLSSGVQGSGNQGSGNQII